MGHGRANAIYVSAEDSAEPSDSPEAMAVYIEAAFKDGLSELLAEATVVNMIQVCKNLEERGRMTTILPFEIYTRENL